MNVPYVCFITRVLRTAKYGLPTSIDGFAVDFLPLLKATWRVREAMKHAVAILNKGKRKSVALSSNARNNHRHLPFSFVSLHL